MVQIPSKFNWPSTFSATRYYSITVKIIELDEDIFLVPGYYGNNVQETQLHQDILP
jgi:hypothetical protein